MIAYRDFKPELPGYVFDQQRLDANFARAVAEANAWIDSGAVDVINVETMGLLDTSFGLRWVRVWHRAGSSKPVPPPEV